MSDLLCSVVSMNIYDFDMPAAVRETLREADDTIPSDAKAAVALAAPFVAGGGAPGAFASMVLGDVLLRSGTKADVAAAEPHFRAALAFSDAIGWAHGRLAYAIDRQNGRPAEAEAHYARAVELMEIDAKRARRMWRARIAKGEDYEQTDKERDRGYVDGNALRLFVECAAYLCDVRRELGLPRPMPLDESLLEWAVANEEVLDDGYEMDSGTWTWFHSCWARMRAITGNVDGAVRGLRRAVRNGQFRSSVDAAGLASELRDDEGDLPGAIAEFVAERARLSIEGMSLRLDAAEQLAMLYTISGDERAAVEVFESERAHYARELENPDLEDDARSNLEAILKPYQRALSARAMARRRGRAQRLIATEPRYAAYRQRWAQA
jgi:hypothetical protein